MAGHKRTIDRKLKQVEKQLEMRVKELDENEKENQALRDQLDDQVLRLQAQAKQKDAQIAEVQTTLENVTKAFSSVISAASYRYSLAIQYLDDATQEMLLRSFKEDITEARDAWIEPGLL
ncbi:hypothetical protein BU26DRAFT_560884 [Trematosphaeria pertusa]|uniref:Uncharacterized protein n=1 Tax=Trematosphaeria pertusa TaxID=390896 RepID=A0A6A6ISR7_9PLEO|nr:uncharacterized protein BU26DRAFT_560884 [Trematosphaeria pertusa]KAF2253595.1 hypothetical protein BU26DRAFT_560884 [Trematosphaeria pertusa]